MCPKLSDLQITDRKWELKGSDLFKVKWLVGESRYPSASQRSEDKWNRVCKKQDER